MAFPVSPRVVYSKNPLVQVVCQLRFPTIFSISKDPTDFQERVRSIYPLYQTGIALPAAIAPIIPPQVATMLSQLSGPGGLGSEGGPPMVHRFFTADHLVGIDLAKDFLRITTKQYRRWEAFRESIVLAIEALEAVYHPPFYLQVELRYQDIIDRDKLGLSSTPWSELINRSLIGLLADTSIAAVTSTRNQTLLNLGDGELLNLVYGLAPTGSQGYAIDANFYATGQQRTREQALASLDGFNREAGHFFRWAITSKLHNAMQPDSI